MTQDWSHEEKKTFFENNYLGFKIQNQSKLILRNFLN